MIEKRSTRKQTSPAKRISSPNTNGRARRDAQKRRSTTSRATHDEAPRDSADEQALLAVLVPVHSQQGDRQQPVARLEAPPRLDWDHSVSALIDAASPKADLLRQLVAVEQPDPAPPEGGELLAATGLYHVAQGPADSPQHRLPVEPLSRREQDVLRLIAQGLSNQEIARSLTVAVSTVKMHIKHIYGKLGVSNRVQAITHARLLHMF